MHRSPERTARLDVTSGLGVAAAVATLATAAALPTSPRPVTAMGQHRARPVTRHHLSAGTSARASAADSLPTKEVPR